MISRVSDAARREIDALAQAGALTPRATVERARDVANPLHPYFTWDEAEAAQERREDQARALIRSVRVVITFGERLYEAPRYVHDPHTLEQGYIPTIALRDDRDAAARAIRRELVRALSCLRRAEGIAAAAAIRLDVDEVAALLTGLAAPPKAANEPDSEEAPLRGGGIHTL